MMNDGVRLVATMVIWIAFAILTGGLLTTPVGAISQANGGVVFGIVMVLSMAAAISTAAIWAGGRQPTSQAEPHFAKAKRTRPRRIEDLVNSLEDDEVYELETLLLAREDEEKRRGAPHA